MFERTMFRIIYPVLLVFKSLRKNGDTSVIFTESNCMYLSFLIKHFLITFYILFS